MNEGKDHGLTHAARVEASLELTLGVSPGLALEIGPGLTLEINPGLDLEAGLEIMLGPTVKAALMVTYRACIPGPPSNLCPGGE